MDSNKQKYQKILKLFFGFLKLHNAYSIFLVNYLEQGHWLDKDNTLERNLLEEPQEAINYAFCWDDTPQHHAFWSKLHDEWFYVLNDYYSYERRRLQNQS